MQEFYNILMNQINYLGNIKTLISEEKNDEIARLREEVKSITSQRDEYNQKRATLEAKNTSLEEKLSSQKLEVEELNKKFTLEFENIANKIFENKSQKFTWNNTFLCITRKL